MNNIFLLENVVNALKLIFRRVYSFLGDVFFLYLNFRKRILGQNKSLTGDIYFTSSVKLFKTLPTRFNNRLIEFPL